MGYEPKNHISFCQDIENTSSYDASYILAAPPKFLLSCIVHNFETLRGRISVAGMEKTLFGATPTQVRFTLLEIKLGMNKAALSAMVHVPSYSIRDGLASCRRFAH